jgi:FHA domain/Double zinc ribbon
MTNCPNCDHLNPENAIQCESCFGPLASPTCCPNCGAATLLPDVRFCGQCGFNLQNMALQSLDRSMVLPLAFPAKPLIPNLNSDDGGAAAMPTLNLNLMADDRLQRFTPAEPMAQVHLQHLQTQTRLNLPPGQTMIYLGKPNDRIPPDIDISGFPNAEIVSRIHANIRIEGDAYYVEDVGSSNGTYINNMPLLVGSRHRLTSGDRISLGKGDKVTFQFQAS